jgi:hypothetical protein
MALDCTLGSLPSRTNLDYVLLIFVTFGPIPHRSWGDIPRYPSYSMLSVYSVVEWKRILHHVICED